ncbi:hypothetical protein SERLA73DRAFT_68149 [Serpula lacrymans var. lacrymans S7.3]|uniref:Uncharacterized protein n=1 Tax=Serpula lacrymans var. lacrymans (strain S7.3) TaxID=936435 RepID=F8PH80_SERL3|nr:hypothetical protein SERLA73DRAFT_68149 [Serpula lacrymans var. lacrymans S7.3]
MSEDQPLEELSVEEHREDEVFKTLLNMIPGFKDQLTSASISEDDIEAISELIQKGCSGAQSDDTKALKG